MIRGDLTIEKVIEKIASTYLHLDPETLAEEYNRMFVNQIEYVGDGYFSFLD